MTRTIKFYRELWRLIRDILLFFLGAAGVIYETVWADPVNQPLLILFAGMMGLPAFLRADENEKL